MNRTRFSLASIAVLACALTLAACGGKKSSSAASGSTAQTGGTSAADKYGTPSESAGKNGKKPASGTEGIVRKAAMRMEKAIQAKDANFLCSQVYSTDYVVARGGASGCVAKTKAAVGAFKSHSMKIKKVSFISSTDAQVLVKLQFSAAGPVKSTTPMLYFKLEGNAWRYYIRTAPIP